MDKASGNPKASIIILAYNDSESIAAAIDSVLAQNYSHSFEIVIGEDDSSDDTRQICIKYAERYPDIIRLMPHAPNKGIVKNYFDCLQACRGEYIADCAGDDVWADPDRLQLQSDFLDNNPRYIAVMSDWTVRKGSSDVSSSEIPRFSPFQHNVSGREMLINALGVINNFPMLSAFLFRRKPIDKVLSSNPEIIRREDWRCEDLPLVVTLASLGDFGYLPLNAAVYVSNPAGVTNNPDKSKLFDFYLATTKSVLDLADIYNVSLDLIKPAIQSRFNYLASLMIALRDSNRRSQLIKQADRAKKFILLKTKLYLLLTECKPLWRLLNLHFN